jgi:DNA-binding NarL/FixJ family response regulator
MIVRAARQAGALGYVLKPTVHQDLVIAVKRALHGEFFVSPSITNWQPARG